VVVDVTLEKFIGIRVSREVYEKIKKLKITSKELRKLIEDYVRSREQGLGETPKPDSVSQKQDLDSKVSDILSKFERQALEYVNALDEFCDNYAKEVAKAKNITRDDVVQFIYDSCRYSLRTHAFNTLKQAFREKILPLLGQLSDNEIDRVQREIIKIIDKAVKELYPEPHPPLPPI